MPAVKFNFRASCRFAPTPLTTTPPRYVPASATAPPRVVPRAPQRNFRSSILGMAAHNTSGSSASSGDELKLKNRLSESRSPYVRAHMNNPVAWQMWGPEAIELAKKSNRLIFISIGYAACHWCHVMERESFENDEVAKLLNENFIPIKIDREERPDVDRIYMNYRCLDSAKEITAQLRDFAEDGNISRKDGAVPEGLDLDTLDEAYEHFKKRYDKVHAGFGGAPKFPTPSNLRFLLKLSQYPNAVREVLGAKDCTYAKDMVLATLDAMNKGGIHDQIGNGFARYSVTKDWSLPHFEKMLYDQAQLLPVYLDAYLITKSPEHLSAVHDIATYITSPPMQAESGGFFSSEDADSLYRPNDKEKREGAFYPELAQQFGLSEDEVKKILDEGRQKLLNHRNKERPRPGLDDKIVVSWNGLAIGALARTSAALASEDPTRSQKYLAAAEKAAAFIREELYSPASKTLIRVYREGPGDAPGFADDYAYLISGLIDLYEATFNDTYLQWADDLQQTQLAMFWDKQHLGFFSTPEDQKDLIMRLKDGMDNAEPGTNGVSAQNLDRLGALLEHEDYTKKARDTASAFEAEIMQHPFLFPTMMDAVVAGKLGLPHSVLTGKGKKVEEWLQRCRDRPSGLGTLSMVGRGVGEWLVSRNQLVKSLDKDKEGVMVCENGACRDALSLDMGSVGDAVLQI
ncbi:DUF255 domain [Pyrenophora seminiperda CCB06]|uniref:DUF255 domain n=1 Tax=Pyrenophora seminiperda CCB06 TaxID=1302712 RepID=A0A3M7LYE6_9PLEO|nr:DUF255 domain [Pyrenophora seminiperda CCB06]